MGVVVTALQIASCLGWGAIILAVLGLRQRMDAPERLAMAFALGMGLLGWLVFWPGIVGLFTAKVLAAILMMGWVGLPFLGVPTIRRPKVALGWLLLALALAHLSLDVVEVLAPVMDADSLAYHYDLPKRFLEQGAIRFVPRAVDGAVPLLLQLTYAPLLAWGGETALQLWAMATTWAAAGFLFALARRPVGDTWAAVLALLFLGTPAVVYGGGTGQSEVRMAAFVLAAAYALGRWRAERHLGWVVVAGLACGFLMASKFTGLLFAAAGGGVILSCRRRLVAALVFGIVALAAGGQWYGWNAVHTGDPVFPMLFRWLGVTDPRYWTVEADSAFRVLFLESEAPLPRNLVNFFFYPFIATFAPPSALESGRVGLGPLAVMALPLAVWGAWRRRGTLMASPYLPMLGFVLLFYALWFLLGGSQRVRHLLPLWPLLLLLLAAACRPALADGFALGWVKGGAAALLAVQLGGTVVANRWFLTHLGQPDSAYFRPVSGLYPLAEWANATLAPGDKLLNPFRDINYLLDVPFYHAHPVDQALVEILPAKVDSERFWRQVRALGITHVPMIVGPSVAAEPPPLLVTQRQLVENGCAHGVATLRGRQSPSKALGGNEVEISITMLRLTPESCPYEVQP